MEIKLALTRKQFNNNIIRIESNEDRHIDGTTGTVYNSQEEITFLPSDFDKTLISEINKYGEVKYPIEYGVHVYNSPKGRFAISTSPMGNTALIYQSTQDGNYYAYFDGTRATSYHLWNVLPWENAVKSLPIVSISTNAPKDMYWWEEQADYLIRMGAVRTAKQIAQEVGDIPHYNSAYETNCGQNIMTAYLHFKRLDDSFDDLIYKSIFEHKHKNKHKQLTAELAEAYLLNKYRNKKIKPEKFTGKDLIAWNLLNKETQERILRWA